MELQAAISHAASASRTALRPAFAQLDRRPEVYFYTSNVQKYMQARLVFGRAGLRLRQFRSTAPYAEDYSGTKQDLLAQAVREVAAKIGQSSFLFIEDTSVRIEALSSGQVDVPGLAVKEWFEQTSFERVDASLRNRGNDRRAVVKSDIALHVPYLGRPVFLHGETVGSIATSPPAFYESPQYPWLTPHSFNGWIIPEGASHPLGAMSIDESWAYDFRIEAFDALLDRLEEYTAVLNSPAQAYTRRRRTVQEAGAELSLFPSPSPPVYVIIGFTNAGKTTFGDHVAQRHGFVHIEASSVWRMIRHQAANSGGEESTRTLITDRNARALASPHPSLFESTDRDDKSYVDVALTPTSTRLRSEGALPLRSGAPMEVDTSQAARDAAAVLAEHGQDVVAREILRMPVLDGDEPVVITGFRTPEELDTFCKVVPRAEVVLVQTSERLRYERDRLRARRDASPTLKAFRSKDEEQARFGLLRVAEDVAHLRISNEGLLEEYLSVVGALVQSGDPTSVPGVLIGASPRRAAARNQLYRALRVLEALERPVSCDEIERRTLEMGRAMRHNNANKVLRRVPELAARIEDSGERVRYQLTEAGRAYLRLVDLADARRPRNPANADP